MLVSGGVIEKKKTQKKNQKAAKLFEVLSTDLNLCPQIQILIWEKR